jgi:hypothetical protein
MTSGLSSSWVDRLESLSGYQPIYPLGDANSGRNPVSFCHWRVTVAGKARSILSRVAFAGADYSQRSNKFAHHVVLETGEQASGGPVWMMRQRGLMRSSWSSEPQLLPVGPEIPVGDRAAAVCTAWASITGDAGWGGVLAESFINSPSKPAYVIFEPGTDVLALFEESIALLSLRQRWEVSFNTYFTELPLNLICAWRAVAAGTQAAKDGIKAAGRPTVIDLTRSALGAPADSVFVTAARAGRMDSGTSKLVMAPTFLESARSVPLSALEEPSVSSKSSSAGPAKRRRLERKELVLEEPSDIDAALAELPLEEEFDAIPFPQHRRSLVVPVAALIAALLVSIGVIVYAAFRKSQQGQMWGQASTGSSLTADQTPPLDSSGRPVTNLPASNPSPSAESLAEAQPIQSLESPSASPKQRSATAPAVGAPTNKGGQSPSTQSANPQSGSSGYMGNAPQPNPSEPSSAPVEAPPEFALDPDILEPPRGAGTGKAVPSTRPTDISSITDLRWPDTNPAYQIGDVGSHKDLTLTRACTGGREIEIKVVLPPSSGFGGPEPHSLGTFSIAGGRIAFTLGPDGINPAYKEIMLEVREALKYSTLNVTTSAGAQQIIGFTPSIVQGSLKQQFSVRFKGGIAMSTTARVDGDQWTIKPIDSAPGWTLASRTSDFSFNLTWNSANQQVSFTTDLATQHSAAIERRDELEQAWNFLQLGNGEQAFNQYQPDSIKSLDEADKTTVKKLYDRIKEWFDQSDACNKMKPGDPQVVASKAKLKAIGAQVDACQKEVDGIRSRLKASVSDSQPKNLNVLISLLSGQTLDLDLKDDN